jgi:hypothetical protein
MTGAVLGLVASYAVLARLLLSLNLRSAWHWTIKAVAIALTAGFFVVAFVAIEALLGWPTEARPPAQFQLHAALVLEPNRGPRLGWRDLSVAIAARCGGEHHRAAAGARPALLA